MYPATGRENYRQEHHLGLSPELRSDRKVFESQYIFDLIAAIDKHSGFQPTQINNNEEMKILETYFMVRGDSS